MSQHLEQAETLLTEMRNMEGEILIVEKLPSFVMLCELSGIDPDKKIEQLADKLFATEKESHADEIRAFLIKRISGIFDAAIETEVGKERGLFDVILGGVSDVGEILGKFGRDVKPLTDRMQEIAGIARRGAKEYERLPPPEEVKQLPAPDAGGHTDTCE